MRGNYSSYVIRRWSFAKDRRPRTNHQFFRCLQFQQQGGASLRTWDLSYDKQHGGSVFYRTLKTKPGSQWDAACHLEWNVAEIDGDQTEAAAL